MSDGTYNPFAVSAEMSGMDPAGETGDPLAGRMARLGAAIVDGILMLIIIVPVQFASGYITRTSQNQASVIEQLLMALVGIGTMLLLNGYLLAKRGQTLGKIAAGVQIVDYQTGHLLPFLRVYVYRYLWNLPLVVLAAVIPGTADDIVVNLVILIGVLMIFGAERRCLHDYIAGSKVVVFKPGRA